jgi:hypothetical protein
MILKIKDILAENSKITVDKLKEFFSLGLELGIFKVIGNEGSEIIYETNENKTVTGHEVLLNETGKENPVKLKLENHDLAKNLTPPESSRAARVGNSVTSGFSNPFAGTSWGK